jgi:hypothetical protein
VILDKEHPYSGRSEDQRYPDQKNVVVYGQGVGDGDREASSRQDENCEYPTPPWKWRHHKILSRPVSLPSLLRSEA